MQGYYQVSHRTSRQPIYNCYRHGIQSPQHINRNIKAKLKSTNQNGESLSSVSLKVQERKHTASFQNIKPLKSHQRQTNMSLQAFSCQKQRKESFITMLKKCRMRNDVYPLNGAHATEFSCKAVMNSTTYRMRPFPFANDIEAVLFDVDGTLCDSDALHYITFRDMLQEVGFQGGVPITEEFFSKYISGKHNDEIGVTLFPDWDESRREKFLDDKEALFRTLAPQHLKAVNGIHKLCKWIESHRIRRAAVSNAPRANAELMISILGLTDFFELVIVGSECERAKPFPDPYLKALEQFKIPSDKAFAIEDSPSGLKAAVAAGLPVLGVTTRNPPQELLDAGATFLIKDFEDPSLWNALESRNAVKPGNIC